jgi:hypothetical protein
VTVQSKQLFTAVILTHVRQNYSTEDAVATCMACIVEIEESSDIGKSKYILNINTVHYHVVL